MQSYRKMDLLREIWKNPENFELTPTEKMILEKLETFIQISQAYNGKIVCGDHGIGKTFTIRYLLSKLGCLNDVHYTNINRNALEEINKENIGIKQKNKILELITDLIRSVDPILVLDSCEILSLLDSNQRMEFIRNVHYQETKTLLILPTELNPQIPSITINFPNPNIEDYKIFLHNMRMKIETPSPSIPFTKLIRWSSD